VHPAVGAEKSARATRRRRGIRTRFYAVGFGALALVTLAGLPYYVLSVAERVRSPLHPWFRSSGYVGQSAGLVAFALFVFLWLYPLRKKFRWLAFTGCLPRWLDVHVFVGLMLPPLAAIHAAWRFQGLIGLGYASMFLVSLSGIVGRYIYTHIPRSIHGLELGIEEARAERTSLVLQISSTAGFDPVMTEKLLSMDPTPQKGRGLGRTLGHMLSDDLARWRLARELRRKFKRGRPDGEPLDRAALEEVLRLARRQVALAQQSRMYEATHKIFRFWHVAHRPIAFTALGAVLIHVVVVVALGTSWLW
jgi:hypothetical protein